MEKRITFPAPLIGTKFCGASKYLPLLSSFSIFLKEKPLMFARFHVETSWIEGGRLVDGGGSRIIFERPVSVDDGLYLRAKDGIIGEDFWLSIEPRRVDGSPVRKIRFGFQSAAPERTS